MHIVFDISKLNKYVEALTGQIGIAKNDYQKYVCDEDKWALLAPMYETAVAEIQSTLRRKLTDSIKLKFDLDATGLDIHTDDDNPIKEEVMLLAASELRLCVVYTVCYKWLHAIDSETAEVHGAESESHLQNALDALRVRNVDASYADDATMRDKVDMANESESANTEDESKDNVHFENGEGDSFTDEESKDNVYLENEENGSCNEDTNEDNQAMLLEDSSRMFESNVEDMIPIQRTEPCGWPGHYWDNESRVRCTQRQIYNK